MSDTDQGWYSDEAATLGDRIAGAREAAALTQDELALKLGVQLDTLRKWEEDRAEPRANRIQMLAGMLGVTLNWLLTGQGDGPEGPTERAQVAAEVVDLLDEVRMLQGQIARAAAKLGQAEKRLRRQVRDVA